ncbi:hypothetical protein AB0P15_11185 [Streptomyces sp. NPDC087917]|uniref:hypothetical protein n=1 Tax=unclassified Streptomyces TaxID=2593676 RepID=UPI00343EBEEE
MSGSTDVPPGGERPVERLLREALSVRADEVTVRLLRPADPPGPHLGRLSARALWRRRSAWTLAGFGGLAAAALAGYLVLGPGQLPDGRPVPPAAPPELTTPTPSPGVFSPAPAPSVEPSPSEPRASPSTAGTGPAPATGKPTPPRTPSTRPAGEPPHTGEPSAGTPPTGTARPSASPAGAKPSSAPQPTP